MVIRAKQSELKSNYFEIERRFVYVIVNACEFLGGSSLWKGKMSENQSQENESIQQKFRRLVSSEPMDFCPFLGFRKDPQVRARYASAKNYCHRGEKPIPASRTYQKNYCLTSSFNTCKYYLNSIGNNVKPQSVLTAIDFPNIDDLKDLINGALGTE